MRLLAATLLLAVQFGLVGCRDGAGNAVAPASGVTLSLEPGQLASCEPVMATVRWDTTAAHSNVDAVQIWVGDATQQKLWIASAAEGEARTGPWVRPGAVFVLRSLADGAELARVTVPGPYCNP